MSLASPDLIVVRVLAAPHFSSRLEMAATFILLGLAAVIGIAVGVWLCLRLRSGGGAPRCARCGYDLRGSTSLVCSECGADLREAGIIRGGARSSGFLFWAGTAPFVWAGAAQTLFTIIAIFVVAETSGEWIGASDGTRYGLVITVGLGFFVTCAGLWFISRQFFRHGGERSKDFAEPRDDSLVQPTVTRNLTVMFVDMQCYTARAEQSSRDELIKLVQALRELVEPIAGRRAGRIVKTIGDALLIRFDSPTEAVLAAADIQRAAAPGNNHGIVLRIGISTGDVALASDDMYGSPVNLASRIQQLAPPGEVYFSESTFHAMTKSEVPCERAGDFEVKGVAGQVTVYRAT